MSSPENQRNHTVRLWNAFDRDGYTIVKTISEPGRTGIVAQHKTAANYDTGLKKKAYYLEGSNYEMGYLLGLLAEEEVSSMSVIFTERIAFAFFRSKLLERVKPIQEALVFLVYQLAKSVYPTLPQEIRDEIQGIYDGCKKANPHTKVSMERLIALNMGIDIICAMVYTGHFLRSRIPEIKPFHLRIPFFCNGFSVFGSLAGNGHYFGRDFMFPTAEIFQDTASLIIYNPAGKNKRMYPHVSVSAPGLAGSIAAMNSRGVAIGVDMSPGANCDPNNAGTNSLLLNRLCAQNGGSAEQMVEIIKQTDRGVSWNYIIADGTNDKACIVEAGSSSGIADFIGYIPKSLRSFMPNADYIFKNMSAKLEKGLMVRWSDYQYPSEYLAFNQALWSVYNKERFTDKQLYEDAFAENGYINKTYTEKNCPSTFYFAPQRENDSRLVITTNHYVIPEMRFCAMHPWTAWITGDQVNDIQWRYDELSNQILRAIRDRGFIDFETARELIDFLAPYRKFPDYYSRNPRSKDGRQISIQGCTSIFDLKNKVVESHYGYYCDEWVRITLPDYSVD